MPLTPEGIQSLGDRPMTADERFKLQMLVQNARLRSDEYVGGISTELAIATLASLLSAQALIETCEAALKTVAASFDGETGLPQVAEKALAAIEAHKKGEGA